jgi:hypothetical protein
MDARFLFSDCIDDQLFSETFFFVSSVLHDPLGRGRVNKKKTNMFLRVHVVWPDISLIRIDSWAGLIGSGRDEAPPPQEYDGWGRCCCCCYVVRLKIFGAYQ